MTSSSSEGDLGPRESVDVETADRRVDGSDWLAADAVVDRFNDAFARHDVDAVMAAMTDDCVFDSTSPPDGRRYVGQDEVRGAWTAFFAENPDASFATEARFSSGERVVVQWRFDWPGDPPGHVRGVDLFRVRDGLVAEKVSYVKG